MLNMTPEKIPAFNDKIIFLRTLQRNPKHIFFSSLRIEFCNGIKRNDLRETLSTQKML